MAESEAFDRVLDGIMLCGLLPEAHVVLPSVVGLVIGEPAGDAWREHPQSGEVLAVVGRLAQHEDVLSAPLVAQRTTWIHRQLWPSLLAVVTRREPWQMKALPPEAADLLEAVDESGEAPRHGTPQHEAAARALAERLLVHAADDRVTSWPRWCRERHIDRSDMTAAGGRFTIEETILSLCRGFHCGAPLPWSPASERF